MKWIVALAALLCAAPTTPQETGPGTPFFAGMPPVKYQANNAQVVVFTSDLRQFCGAPEPGMVILGCARKMGNTPVLFLPNPCLLGDREFYARIACHELGHRNGWTALHEPETP